MRQTETLGLPQRLSSRLAASYAMEQAAQVVDTAYHAAGSTAIFASGAFERRFRDVHAVAQQIHGRAAHYEAAAASSSASTPNRRSSDPAAAP